MRCASNKGFLTYKGVVSDSETSILKVCEEIESAVDAPERVVKVFERLAFHRSFRYQKYRTVYHLKRNDKSIIVTFGAKMQRARRAS